MFRVIHSCIFFAKFHSRFAPKIHRSTFLSNRLNRRSFVLDRVYVSEAHVSTGLISTLYINILVFFFEVKWDLRQQAHPHKVYRYVILFIPYLSHSHLCLLIFLWFWFQMPGTCDVATYCWIFWSTRSRKNTVLHNFIVSLLNNGQLLCESSSYSIQSNINKFSISNNLHLCTRTG
jgi:hypothetical protein